MRLNFCVACGERNSAQLEHHHLVPRSLGGPDTEANLVTLCAACHGRVHGMGRVPISKLTKAGLAAAKARGVKLGGYRGHTITAAAGEAGRRSQTARAGTRRLDLEPVLAELRAAGIVSLGGIAGELNARGIPAARGGTWTATQVRRLCVEAW